MRTFAAPLLAAALLFGCASGGSTQKPLRLRRVVLYQNGIGYFERSGVLPGDRLRIRLAPHEVDDVLKTLTVIDLAAGRGGSPAVAAGLPDSTPEGGHQPRDLVLELSLALSRGHELLVAYTSPTPAWKPSYRVYLDGQGAGAALVQAWATVHNVSEEAWTDVELTLSTGAPLSFAIDLHTPELVARPDVNGTMVQPAARGAIRAESALASASDTDPDRDGIQADADLCASAAEDRDGFEDADGCPDGDNDRDRIVDGDDRCPNEPETYNGMDDDDGCPDRGRVVVTDAAIEILDKVYFPDGAADIGTNSMPIVDAIAATLMGNPDIESVELGGHAAEGEPEAWGLAARRAGAVRAALVERGVAAERLKLVPFGASQPVDPGTTAAAQARNRRVEFRILSRASDAARTAASAGAPPFLDARAAERSIQAAARPRDVAGSVRYAFAHPVTIARGSAALVTLLNHRVPGEEAFLFRPDPGAPDSARHPFRAVRFENRTGFVLEPGPVAFFTGGTFAGEGLLGRLSLGETAFIPFALDSSAAVEVDSDEDSRPSRIVAAVRGVITVEDLAVRVTRYRVQVGRQAPARIFLRHARTPGFAVGNLPPGTETTADAYLVPLPVTPGKVSTLAVEERRPLRRSVMLLDGEGAHLALYLENSALPFGTDTRLRAALDLRAEAAKLEADTERLREGLGDVAGQATEIQGSLRAIEHNPSSAELRRRLVARLAEVNARSNDLARKLAPTTATLAEVRIRLQDAVRELVLEEKP